MLGVDLPLPAYLDACHDALREISQPSIQQLSEDLFDVWKNSRFVFVCGNGGAGSTAGHFAEDLLKSTVDPREFGSHSTRRMKVLSLSENTSSILAWANDEGFDRIFIEQLKNFASHGDLLIAMSGSGNSPNVLQAVDWGNSAGLTTWGLTGKTGGKLGKLARRSIHVPTDDMGIIQSVHLMVFHWILDDLHGRINSKGRYATTEDKLSDPPEVVQHG